MSPNRSLDAVAIAEVAKLIADRKLSQRAAAQRLGVSRQAFSRLLKRKGCPVPRRQPKLRHHRPTGQAFVEIAGKREYLGPYGSPTADKRYHARLAQLANAAEVAQKSEAEAAAGVDRPTPAPPVPVNPDTLSVNWLLRRYWEYKENDYRRRVENGLSDAHLDSLRIVVTLLADHAGETLVKDFGKRQLFEIREDLINRGCCRNYINKMIGYAKNIFDWGEKRDLVDERVAFRMSKFAGLRPGETSARETEEVEPVPDAWVEPVYDHVAPCVAAMMRLQRLTGMRSDNVAGMRGCDLNMSGEIWVYTPARHKMSYRGHRLRVAIGPKAQAVIRPFLRTNLQEHLFRPADADEWHREAKAAARKTKRQPSQVARAARAKGTDRKRPPGDRYTSRSYYRAVIRGIEKCNRARFAELSRSLGRKPTDDEAGEVELPAWHPHRLRHSLITDVRKRFGLEVAQIAAGHRDQKTTERYSRTALSDDHAWRIALQIG